MTFYTLTKLPIGQDKVPTDGSDIFGNGKYTLKIAETNTGHVMEFPAFISSIKYNTTKDMEVNSEADKWSKVVTEYTGDFSIDFELNLPASSPQQAKTNVAKIENLQKLLLNPYYDQGVEKDNFKTGPLFKVLFANLIHDGQNDISTTGNSGDAIAQGFSCIIESVNYAPNVEFGFFEYEDSDLDYEFLYPKLITLNLSLKIENKNNKLDKLPIDFINNNDQFSRYYEYDSGNYLGIDSLNFLENSRDIMAFPFGIKTDLSSWKHAYQISKKLAYGREMYISINRNSVVCIFPAFIEGFSRSFEVTQNFIQSKSGYVGKGIDTGKFATPSKIGYELKFSVPCSSIEESIIFSQQIQMLMRIFYRPRENEYTGDPGCFVYVPGFIESGEGPPSFASALGFYNEDVNSHLNGINESLLETETGALGGLWMESLTIEIQGDMGFFERNGCLWPKAFSVTTNLICDLKFGRPLDTIKGNMIFPHKIDQTITDKESNAFQTKNDNAFYPFNRDTIPTIGR